MVTKKNVAVSRICREAYCISAWTQQSVVMYLSGEIYFFVLEGEVNFCIFQVRFFVAM